MRPKNGTLVDLALESDFVATALYHMVPQMSASPRTLAKGITQAKPPSGMQALYGWRRVMRDCDRHVPDMKAAARVLKGMNEQLKRDFGQDAMTVDHHIPYPLQSVLRAVRYLDSYSCPTWTVAQHDAMRVTIKFNLSRGPRLDEWCEMHQGDSFYRRANFVWCQATEIIGDTAAVHARGIAIDGLLLRVINVPSKTDRSGVKWAGRHMWYRANSSNPLSFGTEWALWDTRYPCPPELRRQWPAFSPTGDAEPFKPAKARAMLSLMWTAVESASFAALHVGTTSGPQLRLRSQAQSGHHQLSKRLFAGRRTHQSSCMGRWAQMTLQTQLRLRPAPMQLATRTSQCHTHQMSPLPTSSTSALRHGWRSAQAG